MFVDVNGRPFKDTIFHKIINEMYRKSFTLMDAQIRERFPIFILFLECPESECDITHDPMKSFIQFKNLSKPLSLLRWSITQSTYGREGLPPEIQLKYYGDVKGYWINYNSNDNKEEEENKVDKGINEDINEDNNEDNLINIKNELNNNDNIDDIKPSPPKKRRAFSLCKSGSDPLFAERVKEYLMSPIYTQSGYSSDPSDSTSPTTLPYIKPEPPFKRPQSGTLTKPTTTHPIKIDIPKESKSINNDTHLPEIIKAASIPTSPNPITKGDLTGIRVLSQIDNKYILAVTSLGRVYAFDQHAVHERIRLERLEDVVLGRNKGSRGLGQKLGSWRWSVSEEDCSRITKYLPQIISWGFDISVERTAAERPVVVCYKVPVVIQVPLGLEDIVEFARVLEDACGAESTVPPAIRRILALRACRSAIKFGTGLSLDECEELMRLLSECRTPFQCAQ